MLQRTLLVVAALSLTADHAHAVEKVSEQRLFGQCTALIIKNKSLTCESVTLVHNANGRSYFEIPSSDGTILIGGQRTITGPGMALQIDSIDPGSDAGETAYGTCLMQLANVLDSLVSLTCKGASAQSGQFMFVFKPSLQKIDGRLPAR